MPEKKVNVHLKIAMVLISMLLMLVLGIVVFADANWTNVTEGIYQDPVSGDFVFTTIDREKTSDVFYRTFGFTVADAKKDENGKIVETDRVNKEFSFSLRAADIVASDPVDMGNGLIQTTWTIPKSFVYEQIAKTSQEWMNSINNPNGEMYLKFDAIIGVQDKGKYDQYYNPFTGEAWSGVLNDDGTWNEGFIFWNKDTYEELCKLYGWDVDKFIPNHYDQALMIAAGLITGDNNLGDIDLDDIINDPHYKPIVDLIKEQVNQDIVERIGKSEPEFCTYNYSTNGQFNLGDAIPTSEDVTNGYSADEWYGSVFVCMRGKQGDGAVKTWSFGGTITYPFTDYSKPQQVLDPFTGNPTGEITYPTYHKTENYSYTVERAVKYWYLAQPFFYDLDNVLTENTVYEGGSLHYVSYIETQITCYINGINMGTVSGVSNFTPNDDVHVEWPVLSAADLFLSVSGTSRADAIATFEEIAENKVTPSHEIVVHNDQLTVNGKTYMSDAGYPYGEFVGSEGSVKSYFKIGDDDYGDERDEQTTRIPSTIANDKYYTSITVNYREFVQKTGLFVSRTKDKTNSSVGERILGENAPTNGIAYQIQEPIVVHTPTVSPVIIADPDTHTDLREIDGSMDNQLNFIRQLSNGKPVENPDADYQLLLDGTYTIKFIPEYHLEHFGYTANGLPEDLYNKYCKFKQVCFPFTIWLDGKIYEPDDDTTDKEGEPKYQGYTEWIDLPDFTVDDFYIPSWSIEGYDYVIQFRVAPENVVDHNGVNHIDDEEWLKNQTFEGPEGIGRLYDYVSYYSLTAQLSGRIYDFTATGIDDKDNYFGKNPDTGESWGLGIAQDFAFCPSKQEKRAGTLNRLGGIDVRYMLDGSLTDAWDERNTLPFSVGRSQSNKSEGVVRRGNTFAFIVRTMANLWSEEENADYLVITPTFRWISPDGTETIEDVDVYSTMVSADGKETLQFVEMGSDIDKSNVYPASIADLKFDGSYYYEKHYNLNRTVTQDDVIYSTAKANAYLYEKNKADVPTWPKEVYSDNAYLRKEAPCYNISSIVLNNQLRLLTGNLEQLERNLDKEGGALEYVSNKTDEGAQYDIKEATNPELWDKHRMSMQTWFGTYHIPDNLYVTKDKFEADTDGDGSNEEYDTVWDYTVENGSIEGNEDFFIKEGYLVVNFQIETVNEGEPHLIYYGNNDGQKDQWQIEGAPDEVTAGDENIGEDITIPVRSGDVAIIDLTKSMSDRFYVGFNRIN